MRKKIFDNSQAYYRYPAARFIGLYTSSLDQSAEISNVTGRALLIEADKPMRWLISESGKSGSQLSGLHEAIYEEEI